MVLAKLAVRTIVCISLSIWIVFSPQIWSLCLFLAGIGLIVLGAERIVSGIKAEKSRRKYRILNIGIGPLWLAFTLPRLSDPTLVINYLAPLSGVWIISQIGCEIDGLRSKTKHLHFLL